VLLCDGPHSKRNKMEIKYCPTSEMVADYMTKPLLGTKFKRFRAMIMNIPIFTEGQQECVGDTVHN